MLKRMSFLICFGILILQGVLYPQLPELDKIKILERVEALYKVQSYPQALTEVQKILRWDPEHVAARYWETQILFSRKKITDADPQFDLLLADIEFLDTVAVENPHLQQRIRQLLKAFQQQFATLIIRIPDAPMVGYYITELKMQFLSPIQLSPLQRARLRQFNVYFDSLGKLYFDHFNPRDSIFECHLKGFPVLPQRIRTARYRVVLPQTGDTLALVFNRSRRKALTLRLAHNKNYYYQLPDRYAVVFFDTHDSVRPVGGQTGFISRRVGEYQAVLIPLDKTRAIQIGKAPGWLQRGMMWGGLAGVTFLLFQLAR